TPSSVSSSSSSRSASAKRSSSSASRSRSPRMSPPDGVASVASAAPSGWLNGSNSVLSLMCSCPCPCGPRVSVAEGVDDGFQVEAQRNLGISVALAHRLVPLTRLLRRLLHGVDAGDLVVGRQLVVSGGPRGPVGELLRGTLLGRLARGVQHGLLLLAAALGDVDDLTLDRPLVLVHLGAQLLGRVQGGGHGELVVVILGEGQAHLGEDVLHAEDHVDRTVAYDTRLAAVLQHLGSELLPDALVAETDLLRPGHRPRGLEPHQLAEVEVRRADRLAQLVEVVLAVQLGELLAQSGDLLRRRLLAEGVEGAEGFDALKELAPLHLVQAVHVLKAGGLQAPFLLT